MATGQTVWSGLTFSFTKPNGADGSDPQYQDAITPNAIFARDGTGGIYNVAYESSFLTGTSPEFTEWATDLVRVGGIFVNEGLEIAASNHANLTFDDFTSAFGGAGGIGNNAVGRIAVVHLIPEDIYLDLQFTSWTDGHQIPSGGFAYLRAQPPTAEPTGDYNGDLVVDAADYTVWRDTLGQMVETPGDGADGDGDGTIGQGDYIHWKDRFGDTVPTGTAAARVVPEPVPLTTLVGGLLLLAARIGRRISPRGPGQDF